MRNELERIQLIEKYLQNQLTNEEKSTFEKQLATDPKLQEEVKLQQEVLKGIERANLKLKAQKAYQQYKQFNNFTQWGLGGLGIVLVTLAVFYFVGIIGPASEEDRIVYDLPELNEDGREQWSDADKYLPTQTFTINVYKDTVIETKGGIVMAIPANCFIDENGQSAAGKVELEIKEALDAASIMRAGLSSKSGDQLLESAGMFYINAKQHGKSLKINANNGIYAEIPADTIKSDMQLYEGKRMADGSIDWINPKPLEKDLVPVDILSLNFYPPLYLDSLKRWGYDITNKKFTDSLYYSFVSLFGYEYVESDNNKGSDSEIEIDYEMAGKGEKLFKANCRSCHTASYTKLTGPGLEGIENRVPSREWIYSFVHNSTALIESGDNYANKVFKENNGAVMTSFPALSNKDIDAILEYIKMVEAHTSKPTDPIGDSHKNEFAFLYTGATDTSVAICGINPAKIKTIWDEEYQKTLLATREFEARMFYIHKTQQEHILDMYVNGIDRKICSIDSAVAMQLNGEFKTTFLNFAARGEGRVKLSKSWFTKLKTHYALKQKAITEAIAKTEKEFWEKHAKLDNKANQKRTEQFYVDVKREQENFKKELDANLTEACKQLGIRKPGFGTTATGSTINNQLFNVNTTYRATISTTGWCNIDRAVNEATTNRTILNYTDQNTGKTAEIKYLPMSVQIANAANYDKVMVYLLPDKLNSFMRLKQNKDVFEEKLNEFITYNLVCIAYKGENAFFYSQHTIEAKAYTGIILEPINLRKLNEKLNELKDYNHISAMEKEMDYLIFEMQDQKRQNKLRDIRELKAKVIELLFSCLVESSLKITDEKLDRLVFH